MTCGSHCFVAELMRYQPVFPKVIFSTLGNNHPTGNTIYGHSQPNPTVTCTSGIHQTNAIPSGESKTMAAWGPKLWDVFMPSSMFSEKIAKNDWTPSPSAICSCISMEIILLFFLRSHLPLSCGLANTRGLSFVTQFLEGPSWDLGWLA